MSSHDGVSAFFVVDNSIINSLKLDIDISNDDDISAMYLSSADGEKAEKFRLAIVRKVNDVQVLDLTVNFNNRQVQIISQIYNGSLDDTKSPVTGVTAVTPFWPQINSRASIVLHSISNNDELIYWSLRMDSNENMLLRSYKAAETTVLPGKAAISSLGLLATIVQDEVHIFTNEMIPWKLKLDAKLSCPGAKSLAIFVSTHGFHIIAVDFTTKVCLYTRQRIKSISEPVWSVERIFEFSNQKVESVAWLACGSLICCTDVNVEIFEPGGIFN